MILASVIVSNYGVVKKRKQLMPKNRNYQFVRHHFGVLGCGSGCYMDDGMVWMTSEVF